MSAGVSTSRQRPLVTLLMNTSAPPSQMMPPSGVLFVAFAFIHAKLQCSTIVGNRLSSISMSRKAAMRRIWARQVAAQFLEMQQHQVRQFARRPPRCDMLPERPERMAVALHPVEEVLADRGRGLLDRRADPARGI